MSNKNKLGITEGEYTFRGASRTRDRGFDKPSIDNVHNFRMAIRPKESTFDTPTIAYVFGQTEEECTSNSNLLADAGTTANKCGLLPSELLKQRNKAIKILDAILSDLNPSFDEINVSAYKAGKELIQSIEKE